MPMSKRFFYGCVVSALGVNLFLGAMSYQRVNAAEREDAYSSLKLFSTVLERVRQDYVDGDRVSYDQLINAALRGMISQLDPHSEFMEPTKYDDLKKDTSGEFGGVGIVVAIKDGAVTVVAPMEDGPGAKAGILTGDRITRIEGRPTDRFAINDAVKLLRGEVGTPVTITVYRPSTEQTKDYKLVRAAIKVDTVKDVNGHREFPLLDNRIAYIRLNQFGEHTHEEFEAAWKKIEPRQPAALILDLRGNPGGLLDTAVKIVERFVPRGTVIVSTEGRDAAKKSEYRASGPSRFIDLPIVVLVNGGSASASEIVSGALQDLTVKGKCRAIILGEQSFGKGSVQSILPLQGGAALKLTTAKYYTPSHKVIHERGITPDIVVPQSDEDDRDLAVQRSPGGLESLDDAERARVAAVRDGQLDRAIDLLKGLSIYGKPRDLQTAPEKPEKRDKVASR